MKEEIGKRIKELLDIKNGGNQSALADYIGVSPQAVQQWIAGNTSPKGKNLKKAAEFLNASQAYISYGDKESSYDTKEPDDREREISKLLGVDIRSFSADKINMLRQAAQVPEDYVEDSKGILNVFVTKRKKTKKQKIR